PCRNRAYARWTKCEKKFSPGTAPVFFRSPISVPFSDDGESWSDRKEMSGFSPACVASFMGAPNECDINQFSSPAVAPGGKVYVGFENFNTTAENQYMVVSSTTGGSTWRSPKRVDTIFDINFPA